MRILRSHGISNCSAETFRLAKHDQTEAVVPMWNLLKDMIENVRYQHQKERVPLQFVEHCNDIATNNQQQQLDNMSPSQIVLFVKEEFYRLGYMSCDFYQLSLDNISTGSRDLLLAFAWFLCHIDFIGLLLNRMSFVEQALPKSTGLTVPANDRLARKVPPTWNIIDCIKHMILIHGKLRLTCRHLHALQREQNRLAHKLHVSTQGMSLQPGLNHLTPAEAQLLRTNEEKQTSQLEDINSKIEDLLKWKESENVFWKWMESVVVLKAANSDKVLSDGQNASEDDKVTNSTSLGLSITSKEELRLQEAKERLNESLSRCGPYINNLDRVWNEKQPTLSSNEHSKIISEFHAKIQRLDAQNKENSSQKLPLLQQTTKQHSYCFDCPKSQANNLETAESNSRKIIQKKNSLKEDIADINEKIVNLQRKFKLELDSISDEFQHLICVPHYK